MNDDSQPLFDESTPDAADDNTPVDTAGTVAEPALPRARTRWAGIVWGLVLAAVAGAGIWLASAPGRVDDLSGWVARLSLGTAIGFGMLALGALLLIAGIVGLLRRAQRAVAARSGS